MLYLQLNIIVVKKNSLKKKWEKAINCVRLWYRTLLYTECDLDLQKSIIHALRYNFRVYKIPQRIYLHG